MLAHGVPVRCGRRTAPSPVEWRGGTGTAKRGTSLTRATRTSTTKLGGAEVGLSHEATGLRFEALEVAERLELLKGN